MSVVQEIIGTYQSNVLYPILLTNSRAHGHFYYGNKYREHISERIIKAVEQCDSL